MTLEELNALDPARAEPALRHCCGSRRWAKEMAVRRPFRDVQALEQQADNIWQALAPDDWREAFAAHPRIGELSAPGGTQEAGGSGREGEAGGAGGADQVSASGAVGRTSEWAAREQAGVDTASVAIRQRLAAANRAYERRFGFIYIVCATGKTAEELLAIAEQRLKNPPDEELLTAAEEQRKITRLRLQKLVTTND